MTKALVTVLVLVSILGGPLALGAQGSSPDERGAQPVWKAGFVACSYAVCSSSPENVATLGMRDGEVTVAQSGAVKLSIRGLTILSTGQPAANKTLEVWVGSFAAGLFDGYSIGTITTDARGNFHGSVITGDGAPFAFAQGTTFSGQFILNDPGIRSEFVTGFTVN